MEWFFTPEIFQESTLKGLILLLSLPNYSLVGGKCPWSLKRWGSCLGKGNMSVSPKLHPSSSS